MSIRQGWAFDRSAGFTGSADKGKTAVSAHDRSVNGYAKGGKVEGKSTTPPPRPQKHFDRMENFRKERDAEPASPAEETKGAAAGGKWIAGATKNKGALHKELGVPKGEKIPAKKLAMAAKKGGKEGKRARLAETLKRLHKAEGGSVSKNLSQDHKLNRPGGEGTKNVVGFKRGGKARSKGGGGAAQKAAGALAQIAAMAQSQAQPGGAGPMPQLPPGLGAGPGGPPPGGPMEGPPGMKRGGKSHKKK